MGFCIGLGEFNKKYIYILISILCKLIGQIIIGLTYSILKSLSPLSRNLPSSPIIYFTFSFLCSLIIGIICYILNNYFIGDTKQEIIEKIS